MKYRKLKSIIAPLITAAMLFTSSTTVMYADEVSSNKATTAESPQVIAAEEETGAPAGILKDDPMKYDIEINQGFSYHVKKDQPKDDQPTFMSNFVAKKKTAIMVQIDAADEAAAKNVTANWNLYFKEAADENGNDKEGAEPILSWKGDEFSFEKAYDDNSNIASGKMVAYVTMKEGSGPSKGKYNFYLEDNGTLQGKRKNIDFYDTKPLSILAVPVDAYYSKSANVKPEGGGGCPENLVGQAVSCKDNWNGVIDSIKKYLSDVYPVSEITIDEGNTFEGGTEDYDMCTDAGQKKLWEEVSKLQVRDKNTGKDKYDIILAFVMYRQDANGCGQGYTYGKPTNIITLTDKDMLPTVAHEIAHCYDVGDEYDGGSYNYRVNDVPLKYTGTGRDKVTSEVVKDTTEYATKNLPDYDQSKYYWLSSSQYKESLGEGAKVMDKDKDKIDLNGNGSVISTGLRPFILSDNVFVHYADDGTNVFPTISYMGSGYSGERFYYFTTSVIWDHLFNQFLVKEKPENQEESGSSSIFTEDQDEDLDLKYNGRFGESRMVEVSGEIAYTSKDENATVSGCDVDPMFSYDGDLEYIETMDFDGDDKEIPEGDQFVFAALDDKGKVIISPKDKQESIVEFYGGNFNSAMPAPAKGDEAEDKRFQDFCSFDFDAEYPVGTKKFIVVSENKYSKDKEYKEGDSDILWSIDVPDQEIHGEILKAESSKTKMSVEWDAVAFDNKKDEATSDGLYTKIYYAPQGDDGEIYFMEDGYFNGDDKDMYDFGGAKNGYASYSFNPSDYFEENEITDKAYCWIMVSDGVNGLDLFSDEYEKPDQEKMVELVKAENGADEKTQVLGDTLKLKQDGKNFVVSGLKDATGVQKLTVNAGAKIYADELKDLDVSKVTISFNGTEGTAKDVKKHFKFNKKKGQMTLKVYKNDPSYTLMIPVSDKCTLALTVTNVGFDKALKKKSISALSGEGSSISVNLIELKNKDATDNVSKFLSAQWTVDKKALLAGESGESKSKMKVALSNDNRTLTISNPGDVKKGAVKVEAVINGKKYKVTIKVKVK